MLSIVYTLIVTLVICQVAILLTTVYLHRTISHKAMTMKPGLAFACRLILWISTGIRPREWAAVHRKHHAFVDTENDPHSPIIKGFWKVQFGNVFMYLKTAHDPAVMERYAKDLPPDNWDRVLFDRQWLGMLVGVGILFLTFWGNWHEVVACLVLYTVIYLQLNAAINSVGHTYGKRPFAGNATNSQWLAWITAGEGLHNNHHAAPTSARLALHRGEYDPAWWAISACARLGWLTVRHEQPRVSARARRTPEMI